ncbi:MAG TPA: diversity-generating retroelement protein Avd [Candidatus Portnoybacteria bacterium]|jgi:hypothetical protein|nr:diversity-generating retroelement protein Avd [Candidatus Portnoybacteria bacterium]MDD5752090.1 diversity-generating retroelement protein Avd [Candidatus Portnoybacteria bacterium]HNU96978.1 diversity-generating retroelement protein Avd [Candidatus Portnoybacteria bacterium]HOZ16316.1 diversity-generating retroelement protein Avd [Candidatus Portnoybacteria bacterium]HPH51888.1 diversity-generating retroelement protein Avd [Candidatus Portnoybacteria bacterium]
MNQRAHLPIYTKTYDFIKLVYQITRQFKREYKYSLGVELEQIAWQMLDEIIKTNYLSDYLKKDGIKTISALFDRFKIRFRFAFEIDLISDKKFAIVQKNIEEIGKMIGGWLDWAIKQNRIHLKRSGGNLTSAESLQKFVYDN